MAEILQVDVRATAALAFLRNASKRMAYAQVNAINRTAKAIQAEERRQVSKGFIVRKPDFVLRQAAIIKFASAPQQRFEASISVGQKERLLLSGFETGEVRRPFTPGAKSVAVPLAGTPARQSPRATVPREFTVRGLRFIQTHAGQVVRGKSGRSLRRKGTGRFTASITSTGKLQWKGLKRTFILTHTSKAPRGGIYQRIGSGRGDIRMIYSFAAPKALPANLHFIRTARNVADIEFPRALSDEVASAIQYALTRLV